MVEYTGAWDPGAVASFLTDTAVPIRISCRTPQGNLWMLSLWFRYRDGDGDAAELHCATAADADVVRYLRADPGVAFEVSTNRPPYRGVRGRGSAVVEREGATETLRDLIERYLGDTDSDLARWLLSPDREEVRVRIRPEKLYSWDYSDRMPVDDDE